MSKRTKWLSLIGVIAAMVVGWQVAAFAASLTGSNFEIDTDANLKVDNAAPSIDWLTDGNVTDPFRGGVDWKLDTTSGATDESFTQGTKEDTADPVVETGSIPPNKSDLKAFGIYEENDEFLELFWARVQDPSGTTNMDFELNQKVCLANGTNCAPTSKKTPVRTGDGSGPLQDDILITYDLSRGGTHPTISIRKWSGTKWGPAVELADQTEALGSINTSNISDSPIVTPQTPTGALSPRTFGEAAVSFDALFGEGQCGQFGSAYLKSRSSDSFTAALKDFVPPLPVSIGNCPAGLTTTATANAAFGSPISDTAHLAEVPDNAGGTITFKLYGPSATAVCTDPTGDPPAGGNLVFTDTVNINDGGPGDYTSGTFTPTAPGKYYWVASYSGDDSPATDPATTACGDAGETSTVANAPSTISTTQKWLPQDTATVTPTGTAGTVVFTLYENGTCTPPSTGTPVTFTDSDGSDGFATNNNTYVTASTTISWKATFTPTNTGIDPSTSGCEVSNLTITN